MSASAARRTPQAPSVKSESKGRTVTVASKLPMSLILQLCKPQESRSTGRFGDVTETINVPYGKQVVIRGVAQPVGQAPKGFIRPRLTTEQDDPGAFALTPNVDAEFFETWLAQHADTDMVRNGLIFAQPNDDEARAEAADRKDLRSGFEPLDPEKDPRRPKPTTPLIGDLAKDVGAN